MALTVQTLPVLMLACGSRPRLFAHLPEQIRRLLAVRLRSFIAWRPDRAGTLFSVRVAAPLAGGSRKLVRSSANRSIALHYLQPPSSRLAQGCIT